MSNLNKSQNKIRQWYLKYFDWNEDGKVNWWEFLIPFSFILITELIAEIIGIVITKMVL